MADQDMNQTPAELPADPERRGLKQGLYLLPFTFTTLNVYMGFRAVMETLRGYQALAPGGLDAGAHFDVAARAIGWAVVFDALDGRIARLTRTTTEIGVQFDSIADVLTFGIAPAALVYAWGYGSALHEGTNVWTLGWFLSFVYLMCGAFRLARYNVQATRPRVLATGTTKVDKKNFVGLPIPIAAALLAALIHFKPAPLISYGRTHAFWLSVGLMVLVGSLGALMVSTLRYNSFKTVGAEARSVRTVMLLAFVGVLIWLYSEYVLLLMAGAYTLHGPVVRVWQMFRPHVQAVAADVQPELADPIES
jgi:CDP-diacylglycerol---serine O-phosphatidyltransferase